MRRLLTMALGSMLFSCGVSTVEWEGEEGGTHESELTLSTDTRIKNAVLKASKDLYFMSESDHELVWIRSSRVATGPANARFIHQAFSSVTNNNGMADKPLSKLKSETVNFETFAARYKPVPGEDADLFAYHQRMTVVLDLLRQNLKNPVVIRFGRDDGTQLYGAISVYIVGTLPSGRVGGLFTVSVET